MWYFSSITAQLTLQQCLQHILNIYIRYCYNYTTQYTDFAVYICFLYTMWHFFTMTAQFTLQQCLQHILNIYLQCCSQLHYPVYWLCCLHMLSFSQCDIFSQLLHNWLYNNVYSISSTYTYGIVYNYTTQYTDSAVYICFLYTMWHFFTITAQLTLQQCLQHILSITYSTIYNYTTQYTNCAVYIYFPFHNVNIFPRLLYNCLFHYVYSESSLDTYSTVYKLLSPVYCLCCLYMLSFSQCDIFPQLLHNWLYNNVYSISSTYTYDIVTITLPSILTLLFIYASFTQCDIFSQWLHNSLYNNVYSIFSTYTYSTVHNYTTQYTDCAVYICYPFHNVYFSTMTAQLTLQQCLQHILNIYIRYCLQLHYPVYCLCYYICYTFHNMIFFHNYCTIDSTTMSTAYPQHINTILFTITLPSILTLLFIYASF